MKKQLAILATLLLLAALAVAGCGRSEEKKTETKSATPTAQDVKKDINQAAQTTAAYTVDQLAKARQDAAARMADMDKDIDALQAKAATLGDQGKAQAQQALDDLKAKRAEAQAKLQALSAASAAAGKDIKAGYDAAMDSLGKAYETAKKALGQ